MSKIKWQDLAPDQITWSEAMKGLEDLVDEKRLQLMKDQDFHTAHIIDKYLNIIKRGY